MRQKYDKWQEEIFWQKLQQKDYEEMEELILEMEQRRIAKLNPMNNAGKLKKQPRNNAGKPIKKEKSITIKKIMEMFSISQNNTEMQFQLTT